MGLSTHILDTHLGRPAANVAVTLSVFRDEAWQRIGSALTDSDGRLKTLLEGHSLAEATYKLHFDIASYFRALHVSTLYPFVEVVFAVSDPAQHYHIPLLLAANGYSTYRGS